MKKQWFLTTTVAAFIASLILVSLVVAPAAQAKGTEIRTSITGSAQYPNAKGTAKYKVNGTEREFQVEIENVKALAGRSLNVFVNGVKVGSMQVSALGVARLNLNNQLGAVVPAVSPGARVTIKAGTVLVASGRF